MNQNDAQIRKESMPMTLEDALRGLPRPRPPQGLFAMIAARIERERQHLRVRRAFVVALAGVIGISVVTAWFWSALAQELAHSAFFEYVSVLMTDPDVFFTAWQEISLSLLESFPIWNILAGLALLFFSLGSGALAWQLHEYDRPQHA